MPVHLALLSPRGEKSIGRENATPKPNLEPVNVAKEKEVIPMMDTSKYDAHLSKKKRIKKESAERIARICDAATPMTESEIIHLYSHAAKHGTPKEFAEVAFNVSRWTWADCELEEHEED